MAEHANIPHEIVWSLRRKMEYTLLVLNRFETVLKDFGVKPNPNELETQVKNFLEQLTNVSGDLEILTNFLERMVHQYTDDYVTAKAELDYDGLMAEIARYKKDLVEVINRLDSFKEGKLSE